MDKEVIYCELLLLRCRRGDRTSWQDLIDHWERRLFYFIRRIVDDEQDAWDVLQQTWMAAYKGIGSIRDGRALPKWLYQTARNLALMQRRRKHPHEVLDFADEPQAPDSSGDDAIAFDQAEAVHHALGQLPMPLREALMLYFLRDLSIAEIAEVVGVPPGTVKSRLHYGKRALRKALEQGDL